MKTFICLLLYERVCEIITNAQIALINTTKNSLCTNFYKNINRLI